MRLKWLSLGVLCGLAYIAIAFAIVFKAMLELSHLADESPVWLLLSVSTSWVACYLIANYLRSRGEGREILHGFVLGILGVAPILFALRTQGGMNAFVGGLLIAALSGLPAILLEASWLIKTVRFARPK